MKIENFRNAILHFVLKREIIFKHIVKFALALTGFLVINANYGYLTVLRSSLLAVVTSLLCAFIPLGAIGFVLSVFLALHLYGLSMGLSLVFVMIWMLFFVIAKLCGAKSVFNLIYMIVLYRIHIPMFLPVYEGFFGQKRNAAYVVGGAVLAFYLRSIRLSEAAFRTAEDELDAFSVFKTNMLLNLNFYVFVLGVSVLFLLISLLKMLPIRGAWYFATTVGIAAESIILAFGYSHTNTVDQIRMLIISNILTLVFGLIISFLFGDVKVNRRKKLELEDDEYTYVVYCTPKLQIEKSQKRLVRITRPKKEIERERAEKEKEQDKEQVEEQGVEDVE